MKADKFTFTIETESLSKDIIVSLLQEAVAALEKEQISGKIRYDDGDTVRWNLERNSVSI
jgi:hypothetical protein